MSLQGIAKAARLTGRTIATVARAPINPSEDTDPVMGCVPCLGESSFLPTSHLQGG